MKLLICSILSISNYGYMETEVSVQTWLEYESLCRASCWKGREHVGVGVDVNPEGYGHELY